ncbi:PENTATRICOPEPTIDE REPEAT-CONTAINING PROTEIN 1 MITOCHONDRIAL [Salix viminalis]|uniref:PENTATRICOPEPTIDE REPEAT-CONTAINING PROTEIN 1 MITOCHONDRIAL n=1 Tax=Salix viminalis TaxID=40686 RepID=A0A9Q0NYI0_SALVM|nr:PENTATRICOPEPTIDE REPEAT-CONTAINING PROTEIN 1 MITOCHONDRIAL [Salix viminalis]
MCACGLSPDILAYSTLLDGFCKQGNLDEMLVLFQEMQRRLVKPDLVVYTILINGMCKSRKKNGRGWVHAGSCSYNVLLQGCLQHKDTSTAVQLIHEMADRGFYADSVTRTFLKDLLPAKDSPATKQLLGRILEGHRGVKVK